MSYDAKHYDELFANLDAQAREKKTLPSVTITGEQRTRLVETIKGSIEEHRRNTTKVFRDRVRVEAVIADLDRSLAMLANPEKPS